MVLKTPRGLRESIWRPKFQQILLHDARVTQASNRMVSIVSQLLTWCNNSVDQSGILQVACVRTNLRPLQRHIDNAIQYDIQHLEYTNTYA